MVQAIHRSTPIMRQRGLWKQRVLRQAIGFLGVGSVRLYCRCGGGGNGVQYGRNPRSWQESDRSPTRPTGRLVIGIVCAAAVFLSSTALLIGLGTPQDVAAIF